jgi:hypothetical protein
MSDIRSSVTYTHLRSQTIPLYPGPNHQDGWGWNVETLRRAGQWIRNSTRTGYHEAFGGG